MFADCHQVMLNLFLLTYPFSFELLFFPLGLLDKPVVVEGKRERKKTDRIEIAVTSPKTESLVIPEGKGEKLGDCPRSKSVDLYSRDYMLILQYS